jgi:hypothetical protein
VSTIKAALPNARLLIMDRSGGTIPKSMGEATVASTDSCVALGCTPDMDGETKVVQGKLGKQAQIAIFFSKGRQKTPTRNLILLASHWLQLLVDCNHLNML